MLTCRQIENKSALSNSDSIALRIRPKGGRGSVGPTLLACPSIENRNKARGLSSVSPSPTLRLRLSVSQSAAPSVNAPNHNSDYAAKKGKAQSKQRRVGLIGIWDWGSPRIPPQGARAAPLMITPAQHKSLFSPMMTEALEYFLLVVCREKEAAAASPRNSMVE